MEYRVTELEVGLPFDTSRRLEPANRGWRELGTFSRHKSPKTKIDQTCKKLTDTRHIALEREYYENC